MRLLFHAIKEWGVAIGTLGSWCTCRRDVSSVVGRNTSGGVNIIASCSCATRMYGPYVHVRVVMDYVYDIHVCVNAIVAHIVGDVIRLRVCTWTWRGASAVQADVVKVVSQRLAFGIYMHSV